MPARDLPPRYSPRADALAQCPAAVCRRETRHGVTVYVVYDSPALARILGLAGTAAAAWREADDVLCRGEAGMAAPGPGE